MIIAGVDEAGRGCIAGPVYAAAVILTLPIEGLKDSKQLSEKKREILAEEIYASSVWGLGIADEEEIERLNILHASMLAMQRAVTSLTTVPDLILVDGNRLPELAHPAEAIVGGDRKFKEIMAASILAKTARDALMYEQDRKYPGYGFAQHKGYPTRVHIQALKKKGILPLHRRGYAPVRRLLRENNSAPESKEHAPTKVVIATKTD